MVQVEAPGGSVSCYDVIGRPVYDSQTYLITLL